MRPEEAQLGKRVRVTEDHRKTDFRGREGTIAKRWGDPGYPALDILLDEGYLQLFWFHELEEVDEDDSMVQTLRAMETHVKVQLSCLSSFQTRTSEQLNYH